MSEHEYDAERQQLRQLYGESRGEAGVRFEQGLARLFSKCGRSQEWLAPKEGKSQQHIARWLRFGRFLNFTPTGSNHPDVAKLTERKFRSYWERTEDEGVSGDKWAKEEARFEQIVEMLREEATFRKQQRRKLRPEIMEKFGNDGKWHKLADVTKTLDESEDYVKHALDRLVAGESSTVKAERKPVGNSFSYRLFSTDKRKGDHAISSVELRTKLTPILEGLEAEGKKNAVTASPGTVAVLAHSLRKLLEEWVGSPDHRRSGARQADKEEAA